MEPDLKKPKIDHKPNTAVKLALTGYFSLIFGFTAPIVSTRICKIVFSESPKVSQCQDTFSNFGHIFGWGGAFALAIGLSANSRIERDDIPKE
jgi:hypothetical protein